MEFEDVRLNGSVPREGRVEVKRNDQWYPVCDHLWSEVNSQIFCKGIDQGTPLVTYLGSVYGNHGDRLSPPLLCHNNISSCFELIPPTKEDCSTDHEVGLVCSGPNIGELYAEILIMIIVIKISFYLSLYMYLIFFTACTVYPYYI